MPYIGEEIRSSGSYRSHRTEIVQRDFNAKAQRCKDAKGREFDQRTEQNDGGQNDDQFGLYVSDGRHTATNTFTVLVQTPEQIVVGLIDTLDELDADQGVEFRRRNSLEQFLEKAAQLLAAGEDVRAIKQLR